MGGPIERLAWDSDLFGFAVARVACARADEVSLDAALRACRAQGIRCAYLLLDAADAAGSGRAQARGFVVRDLRLELERSVGPAAPDPPPGGVAIGPARGGQRAALERIARGAFAQSRFFADPGFPRERCRELYAAFLRRGLDGAPERLTLAGEDASGFVACHLDRARGVGTIELIAVAEDARGGGVGRALVDAALATFADAGLARAEVVTQGANVASQRLYQRAGFRTGAARLWLHRWFD
jgi:ribosomal protein S18 acetylase RimI-like enzyme